MRCPVCGNDIPSTYCPICKSNLIEINGEWYSEIIYDGASDFFRLKNKLLI